MNKQKLQQEIAELQKQLEEKQKTLAAMPDKWEPKGGEWYITVTGQTDCVGSPMKKVANFGMGYATQRQAEKAVKAMRTHNRLLAYVAEFAPDWEPAFHEQKWFVYFDSRSGDWDVDYHCYIETAGVVYMPFNIANVLLMKLKSGEVEL